MSVKANKTIYFETNLNALPDDTAVLQAPDAKGSIVVAKPMQFGGKGNEWSPEHLFVGAINSCFMITFQSFADKLSCKPVHFECKTIGKIELSEGKWKFTQITISPKLIVEGHLAVGQALEVLDKTKKYCLIGNSTNAELLYVPEIVDVKTMAEPIKC